MIDLYTAFKLTDISDNECVYLKSEKIFPNGYCILTGREAINQYDMRRIGVARIFSWFCCEEYKGFGFEIAPMRSN